MEESTLESFLRQYNHNLQHNSFPGEFDAAKQVTTTSAYTSRITPRSPPVNQRNRYYDIVTLDDCRVHLITKDEDGCDYINASHITGAESVPGAVDYIAAQAPLPSTVSHFWQMCWERRVPVVLMLTPFVEETPRGQKLKADPYFPPVDQVMELQGITVECVERKDSVVSGCCMRRFVLSDGQEERSVVHLHFVKWPDFGHMSDCSYVAKLIAYTDQVLENRDDQQDAPQGPIVVHCSAGVGRTGTYIATDIIRKQIAHSLATSQPIVVDIKSVVSRLRNQRPGMVMTAGQYEMIYHMINHMFCQNQAQETRSQGQGDAHQAADQGLADDDLYKKYLGK